MSTDQEAVNQVDTADVIGSREWRFDPAKLELVVVPRNRWYLLVKAMVDFVIAFVLLVLATPIIIVAAICIRLTSPGPAFYWQRRVGKHGRKFALIKLRTMEHKAEAKTGPKWAAPNDPRVTSVGRLLRNTHIDEFPQLVNVLLGQMSLIGPRPERPEFMPWLEYELQHYPNRLQLRPGITGLAQLKLPPDSDIESVRRKLHYDLYYLRYLSPWLDTRIAIATARYLTRVIWHVPWNFIRLPSGEIIERSIVEFLDENADKGFLDEDTDSSAEFA